MELDNEWKGIIKHFFIHVLTGIAIFAIIAIPAILLDIAIRFLKSSEIDNIIVWALIIAKYIIFFMDLMLFLVFMGRISWHTLKEF